MGMVHLNVGQFNRFMTAITARLAGDELGYRTPTSKNTG